MKPPCRGLVLLLFLTLNVSAADWPQWRQVPDRTGHVPAGVAVPATLPSEPRIFWRVKIGEGLASPVVSADRVFHMDNQDGRETLHALAVSDGRELWRADIDGVFGDKQSLPGPRCTPLVDGGRVYAQSCRGKLLCLNTADGSRIWGVSYTNDFSAVFIGETGSAQGAARHGNNGSPVIDGGRLYASVGGTNGEGVVCFEKSTGKVLWKSQNDQAGYSAPIIATIGGTKQLVDFTADGVIGLDPRDGALFWRTSLKTDFSRHVTTPVVVEDMVLVGTDENGLIGTKISRDGANWLATRSWTKKESAVNFSSPVATGGYLYALGPSKNLICVEIKTGRQMWSQAGRAGPGKHAAFIVMGANILCLNDGGELVLFAADPAGFKEISSAQVCGKTWCNPAYSDGKLFLRDARELICAGLLP